jgi:hypothetical protein
MQMSSRWAGPDAAPRTFARQVQIPLVTFTLPLVCALNAALLRRLLIERNHQMQGPSVNLNAALQGEE